MSSKRSTHRSELDTAKYGNVKHGSSQRGKKRERDKDEDYQPPSRTSRRSNNNPNQDEGSGEEEEEEEEEAAPRSRGKAPMQTRRPKKPPKRPSSRPEDEGSGEEEEEEEEAAPRSRGKVPMQTRRPNKPPKRPSSRPEDDDEADARRKSTPTSNHTKRSRANVGNRMNVPEEVVEEDRVEDELLTDDEDKDGGEIGNGEADIADEQNEGIGDAAAQGAFNQCEQEKKKRQMPKIVTYNGMSATALKTWLEKKPAAKDSFLATRGMFFLFCFCGIDGNFSTL